MPGTPPSVTCSVHSDPDQYRFSCRPEGSINQPGAMPVNVTGPDDPWTVVVARSWDEACASSESELVGVEARGPVRRPRR